MNQHWFLRGGSPTSRLSAGLTRTAKGPWRSIRQLIQKTITPGWQPVGAILAFLGLGIVALLAILLVPAIVYLLVSSISPVLALWMMFATFVLLIFGFSRLL